VRHGRGKVVALPTAFWMVATASRFLGNNGKSLSRVTCTCIGLFRSHDAKHSFKRINLAMSYLSGKLGSLRRVTAEYIWQQFFGGGSAPRLPFPRAATSLKSCYIGPLFLSNLLILYSIDTVCLADLALNNKVAVLLCAHRSPYVV
jgi:hypothetical protein